MARLRPYLVRAAYEWLVDHELTPYFLVDAEYEDVEVPWEYVEDGKIFLNASPMAVRNIQLENGFVSFEASVGGSAWDIYIPSAAVLAIYARETGQGVYAREEGLGMLVNEGEDDGDLDPQPPEENLPGRPAKGGLRIIK